MAVSVLLRSAAYSKKSRLGQALAHLRQLFAQVGAQAAGHAGLGQGS